MVSGNDFESGHKSTTYTIVAKGEILFDTSVYGEYGELIEKGKSGEEVYTYDICMDSNEEIDLSGIDGYMWDYATEKYGEEFCFVTNIYLDIKVTTVDNAGNETSQLYDATYTSAG